MNVVIATKNPGKIEGAKQALEQYYDNFDVNGISVPSDVGEQPVNEEVLQGAKNRVKNLKAYCIKNNIDADLFMSVESGITRQVGEWMIMSVAVIEDKFGLCGCGTSPAFPVPDRLVQKIIDNNFSQVMNDVFGKDDERHNHAGHVQLLTKGKITRIDLTRLAFTMALTRFVNKEWK